MQQWSQDLNLARPSPLAAIRMGLPWLIVGIIPSVIFSSCAVPLKREDTDAVDYASYDWPLKHTYDQKPARDISFHLLLSANNPSLLDGARISSLTGYFRCHVDGTPNNTIIEGPFLFADHESMKYFDLLSSVLIVPPTDPPFLDLSRLQGKRVTISGEFHSESPQPWQRAKGQVFLISLKEERPFTLEPIPKWLKSYRPSEVILED